MFLATTALSEFWDPSGQLLFLGPWCTGHDHQDQWAHRDYLFLPNPWDDRERLLQAALYCQDVHDHLLGELGRYLGEVHQVNFGKRYWQILLGPWLSAFVDIFYDRYVHIIEAFSFCPELKTWLLDEREYQTPWDNEESTALLTGDIYNLQLYSQIITGIGYDFPRKAPSPRGAEPQPPAGNSLGRLKRVLRKLKPLIIETGFSNQEVVILKENLSKRAMLRLALTPGFRGSFLYQKFPPGHVGPQHPARRELAAVTISADPFVRLLVQALPRNFPGLYLEGFQSSRRLILDRYGSRNFPKLLLNWGNLWFDEYGKFLAGEVVERGGGIVFFQHGAGFGISRLMGVERYSRQVSDKFYTWGWAGQENDPKLGNLPGPKTSLKGRQPGESRRHRMIMLVGNTYPRFLYRFQSYPLGTQWLRYIRFTMEFIEALGPQRQRVLFYRGHSPDYGWVMSEQIQERFPQVAVDHHDHSFGHQMNKSRVVVFDHPGTTFLEAMAANVPSIICFDPKYWDFRVEAQPYFDLLRRAGIFHDTPQSAARQVSQVYDHIDSWWLCRSVQEARESFVNHFAMGSTDWNRQLVKAITQELHEVQARLSNSGL